MQNNRRYCKFILAIQTNKIGAAHLPYCAILRVVFACGKKETEGDHASAHTEVEIFE